MASVTLGRILLHLAICSLREGQSRLFSSPPSVVRHRDEVFRQNRRRRGGRAAPPCNSHPPKLSRSRAAPGALPSRRRKSFATARRTSRCGRPSLWVGYCFIWPSVHFGRGRAVCSVHRLVSFVHRDSVSEHSERKAPPSSTSTVIEGIR